MCKAVKCQEIHELTYSSCNVVNHSCYVRFKACLLFSCIHLVDRNLSLLFSCIFLTNLRSGCSKIHVMCMQICQRCQEFLQYLDSQVWKQVVDFVHSVSDTSRGLLDYQCNPLFLIQLLVPTDFIIGRPSNKLLCYRTKAMCAWLSLMVAMYMTDPQLYLEVLSSSKKT